MLLFPLCSEVSQETRAYVTLLETCRMGLFPGYFQECNLNFPKFILNADIRVSLVCLGLAKRRITYLGSFHYTNGS